MNRAEIIALAKRAQTDLRVARGPFRKLAIANGCNGARGGWIYRDGRSVTQGWQALADLVVRGSVRFQEATS